MDMNPKQARETLGLNQTTMAKAMGVSRSTWLHWERKERDMGAAPARLLMALIWLQSENLIDKYFTFFSE